MRISLLLLASLVLTIQSVQANHSLKVMNVHFMRKKAPIVSVPSPRHNKHHHAALSIPRGGAWSILGWNVPANQLAKLYVGFTGINGIAMAVLPTIAANLYGSAFDDSPESFWPFLVGTTRKCRLGNGHSLVSLHIYGIPTASRLHGRQYHTYCHYSSFLERDKSRHLALTVESPLSC